MKSTLCSLVLALCYILGHAAPPPGLPTRKTAHLYVSYFENVLGTSMELKSYAHTQKEASRAEAAAKGRIPTTDELKIAVEAVSRPHWTLDSVARTATHLDDAPLILNSFAKSYIIQHAAAAAMGSGKIAAMVVNISDPKADAENDPPMDQLLIGKSAVATSGNYRCGELIAGHWYSHIVDPRTGRPAADVLSATVVAPDATVAGALATAFNVMTPAKSIQLAACIHPAHYA